MDFPRTRRAAAQREPEFLDRTGEVRQPRTTDEAAEQGRAVEAVEGRGQTKGNTASTTGSGRRAGMRVSQGLDRVRQAAERDKEARFTALLHHVDIDCLREAFWAIRRPRQPRGSLGLHIRAEVERTGDGKHQPVEATTVSAPRPRVLSPSFPARRATSR